MFFGTILLFRCVGGQEIVHECVALLFHQRGKALSVASQFFVVEIKVFMRPFPIDLYLSQHHSLRKFEMEEKAERILVLKRLHLAERCTSEMYGILIQECVRPSLPFRIYGENGVAT